MRLIATAAALALAAALAPAAGAAPDPASCGSYTDAVGDSPVAGADITRLDLGTSRSQVVAQLTLRSLAFPPTDAGTVLGVQWNLVTTIRGVDLEFWAKKEGRTGRLTAGIAYGGIPLTGTLTIAGSTLVWTVPRSEIRALAKPVRGCGFTDPHAETTVSAAPADQAP